MCCWTVCLFQSTLPARGATRRRLAPALRVEISIHAPRTGSDTDGDAQAPPRKISIHAPRTGSDRARPGGTEEQKYFNPRSPHGERLQPLRVVQPVCRFQSTLPARGATGGHRDGAAARPFQSTLPARGATAAPGCVSGARTRFQSTLPARGATVSGCQRGTAPDYFNPRSPHGERRTSGRHPCERPAISIHAPRTGSDFSFRRVAQLDLDFNPRSPHGERPSVGPRSQM